MATNHSKNRAKERLVVKEDKALSLIRIAKEKGASVKDIKNTKIKSYLQAKENDTARVKIYKDVVYVFSRRNGECLTCYPLPNELISPVINIRNELYKLGYMLDKSIETSDIYVKELDRDTHKTKIKLSFSRKSYKLTGSVILGAGYENVDAKIISGLMEYTLNTLRKDIKKLEAIRNETKNYL